MIKSCGTARDEVTKTRRVDRKVSSVWNLKDMISVSLYIAEDAVERHNLKNTALSKRLFVILQNRRNCHPGWSSIYTTE